MRLISCTTIRRGLNLAEFIVRYDFPKLGKESFDINSVLGVNEIGVPCTALEPLVLHLKFHFRPINWRAKFEYVNWKVGSKVIFELPEAFVLWDAQEQSLLFEN